MALSNATLTTGATITVSSGSTLTFTPTSQQTLDGIELINIEETDSRLKKTIVCRSKSPTYNSATNQYTKGKNFVVLKTPKILADLSTVFPTARIELDYHPEQTAAERLDVRKLLAQTLIDADFDNFWTTGSRA